MAVTQADLDAIEAAALRGEKIVRQGDRMVEYQSVPDMLRLVAYARGRVGAAGGVTRSSFTEFARD